MLWLDHNQYVAVNELDFVFFDGVAVVIAVVACLVGIFFKALKIEPIGGDIIRLSVVVAALSCLLFFDLTGCACNRLASAEERGCKDQRCGHAGPEPRAGAAQRTEHGEDPPFDPRGGSRPRCHGGIGGEDNLP